MRSNLLLLIMCLSLGINAQPKTNIAIQNLLEELIENLPEEYDWSEWEEQLVLFIKHPINLNHTNDAELQRLAFLSPLKIAALFSHLKKYGSLIDLMELQQIDHFDAITIKKLLPFVRLETDQPENHINFKNLSQFGSHELLLRLGTLIEMPKGFTPLPTSRYLGTKQRFLMKYRYSFSNRISLSLTLEKDAGEFIFQKANIGFDYQSAHLALFNIGRIEQIVFGDYTLQFGQGLNLWSGYSLGKAADVSSIVTKNVGLKPYRSSNEYDFFRGVAAKIKLAKSLDLTTFFSYRHLDASLKIENGEDSVVTSINKSGLHRTPNEIENKNNLSQILYGSTVTYHREQLNLGAIIFHQSFSRRFVNTTQPYTSPRFTGSALSNFGLFYQFSHKNGYHFGEVGKGSTGGWAHLNGLLVSLSHQLSAIIFYRHYEPNFHNFYHQAIAEGSESTNETGFYAGLNLSPKKSLTISLYVDIFKFPWLKYRIDAPSNGHEILLQVNYAPNKQFKAIFKYKSDQKQQNTTSNVIINFLEDVKKENYSLLANWQMTKSFAFQSRLEMVRFSKSPNPQEIGYLIAHDVDYSPTLSKFAGNIRIAYFNTPSYDSRIYAYEDDVLYNSSFGMYNGKGWRTYLNIKYKLTKKIDLWTRYALFFYPTATSIGTGLDEITGRIKSDLKLQMRYHF